MQNNKIPWEKHYKTKRSVLSYPDENLVRLLKSVINELPDISNIIAADLGCGSGRHIKLLKELGIKNVIGLDLSFNALLMCSELYKAMFVQSKNENLPFADNSIDLVITWGSLHYCEKNEMLFMVEEIHRVLNKNGKFIGTIRTDRDTFLTKGSYIGNGTYITDLQDIKNSTVSFYNEEELQNIFKVFSDYKYGLMERSILGAMDKIISHWFFLANK